MQCLNRIFLLIFLAFSNVYAKESSSTHYYQIPQSARSLTRAVIIPLENIQTEYFVIQAYLNGKGPYRFMLDTGMAMTMISQKVVSELNLQNPIEKIFTGNLTHQIAKHYQVHDLALNEAHLYDYDVVVLPEPNIITNIIQTHKFHIDGILGIGAFYHYLLTLDYAHKNIALSSGNLDKNNKNTLAFAPTNRIPVIIVTFKDSNSQLLINTLIDSGFSGQFTFPTYVETIPFKIIEGHQVKVNSGFNEYIVYKDKIAANAYFSDKVIENPYVLHGKGIYGQSGDYFGLLGVDVIHQYRLTLDIRNRLLSIESN